MTCSGINTTRNCSKTFYTVYVCTYVYVARRRRSSFTGENSADVPKDKAPTSKYDNSKRRSTIDGSIPKEEKKTTPLENGLHIHKCACAHMSIHNHINVLLQC
jgi:hypothetical protein